MHDYSVQVLLSGDFDDAYTDGDNSKVVPTDTVKNTCYFIADKVSFASPEEYAVALGKHFLQTYLLLLLSFIISFFFSYLFCWYLMIERYSWVEKVNTDVTQSLWERMNFNGKPHEHSFSKTCPELRFTSVISPLPLPLPSLSTLEHPSSYPLTHYPHLPTHFNNKPASTVLRN